MKLKNIEDIYELSPVQKGMLFHSLSAPGSGLYLQQFRFSLSGPLNVEAFEAAWQRAVKRHAVLRTCFVWEGLEKSLQAVWRTIAIKIDVADWTMISAAEQSARLQEWLESDRQRGFELTRPPLLRLSLFKLGADDYHFVWTQNHALLDGWSVPLLLEEVFQHYEAICRGKELALERPRAFREYIAWLQQQSLTEAEQFWRRRLQGFVRPTPLVVGRRFSGVNGYAEQRLQLKVELTAKLSQAARQQQLTLNGIVQGAWALLLSRYSGEEDVVFGATVAGRPAELGGVERMLGLFINTLPVRVKIAGEQRAGEWLRKLQAEGAEARRYEHTPLGEVSRWSELPRGTQLFESLLVVENFPSDLTMIEQVKQRIGLEIRDFSWHERGDHPLALIVFPNKALTLQIEYERERFNDATVTRMLDQLEELLAAITADPEQRVGELPVLGNAERRQLLVEWNGDSAAVPHDRCLQELIEARVESAPDRIAASYQDQQLTYRQLNARANQLARYLQQRGVSPETRVGVLLDEPLQMIIGLPGVLKAGGAYVPLDPQYPAERLSFMLEDAGVDVLLTHSRLVETVPSYRGCVVCLDTQREEIERESEANPPHTAAPDNLAYVIYTSGSTGRPKGALVTHSSLVSYVTVISREFALTAEDQIAQLASPSFDVAVEEIFPALVVGARVVFCRDIPYAKDFMPLIRREELTVFELPTAFWDEWVYELSSSGARLPECVRLVLVGGEKNLPNRYEAWRQLADRRVSLIHVFGLTETTITSTIYRPTDERAEEDTKYPLPIGRALPNTQIYVLDSQLRPVPLGVAGELYIGGVSVARGYHQRPELTAERFVPDPFGGTRLYRTGDLVRYLEDGNIEFLERKDEQVKVRGYRIEPAEIEATLAQHPAVRDAVVVAREDVPGQKKLVAYMTPRVGIAFESNGTISELRAYLNENLPEYMVPSAFVALDALPLGANGKIDRRSLPAPDFAHSLRDKTHRVAATPDEETLARIWSEVIRVPEVGVTDNYFELGGDSILSIQIASRANRAGLNISPRDLFTSQTVVELARVAERARARAEAIVTPPNGDSSEECDVPLTPIQRWFFSQNFAEPHYWNQSILLETRQPLQRAPLEKVVAALVRDHAALRLRFTQNDRGDWQQCLLPVSASLTEQTPVHEVDLTLVAENPRQQLLERCCTQAQRSLNLAEGPLLRFVIINLDEQGGQRLHGVAHHLITDGVSWRVLLDELQQHYPHALNGAAIESRPATSFRAWADHLTTQVNSDWLAAQEPYWQTAEQDACEFRIPLDQPDRVENTGASQAALTVSLTPTETEALLREVSHAYRTRIQDALLAALGSALHDWTGRRRIAVWMEGHGRELGGDGPDMVELGSAIGWFTSLYPVVVDAEWDDEEIALKAAKEALRKVPNGGVGYGLWKCSNANNTPHRSDHRGVAFNYLGQFDREIEESSLFTLASESPGPAASPEADRVFSLEINCAIVNGCLQLTWNYSRNLHHNETIEWLASTYVESLQRLINHCRLPESTGFTPSDFPDANLSQAELDELVHSHQAIEDIQPLSPMQRGMLFHCLYTPESGQYVAQFVMTLCGDLNAGAFEQAWQRVLERHTILRTDFLYKRREEPVQIIHEHVTLSWEQQDWSELTLALQEENLETYLQSDRRRGFDLARAPLFRLLLARTSADTYQLVWTLAMMLLDGWSVPLLLEEVFQHYEAICRGKEIALERPRPYRDYLAWLQEQSLTEAEQFWRKRLQGFTRPTHLVTGRQSQGASGYDEQRLQLSVELSAKLSESARRQQLTLNGIVQGAWALLLSRYSGEEDVVFGATVAGRPAELSGVERMLGLFINTLPVRVKVAGEQRVGKWLRQLQADEAEARQYEHTPLVEVSRWCELPRGTQLFDSLLVVDNYPFDASLAGQIKQRLDLEVSDFRVLEQTNFPLALTIMPGDQLSLLMRYECAGFDNETIQRMLKHLQHLLESVSSDVDQRVSDIKLLTGNEETELLVDWNDTHREYPDQHTIHQLFEQQVERSPGSIAVVFQNQRVTYRELNYKADLIAFKLSELGVGPDVRAGVMLDRSVEMVAALLGILKAGGAYVPLDPAYPLDRLTFMLEDSGAQVVLTQKRYAETLAGQTKHLLCLNGDDESILLGPKRCLARPDDLAYVIYTSGSTGKPKGVMVTHRGLVNYLTWSSERYAVSDGCGAPVHSPLGFDLTVTSLFTPLVTGKTVFLVNEDEGVDGLVKTLRAANGYSLVKITPAHLEALGQLLRPAEAAGRTHALIIGGEALHGDVLEFWTRNAPTTRLINEYGPTETVVGCCVYEVPHGVATTGSVAIGKPIANTRLYVLDRKLRLAPVGIPGELYIGGDGLARGYLNRPDLTAEKFIPDPYAGEPGERLYRTGDVARWSSLGELEYLGRNDHQVKVRGYRIELGEIEAAIHRHERVRECAVIVSDDKTAGKRLVAYLAAEAGEAIDAEELRRFLSSVLPEYMIPSLFVTLNELPLSPNGKVDRSALPAPDAAQFAKGKGFVDALTPAEDLLAGIWSQVLGVENVGVTDNFFELGGHSLLATQVVSRIREAFQVELPLRHLFESPTVAELAQVITQESEGAQSAAAGVIGAAPRDGELPLSFAQQRLWFLNQWEPSSSFYNSPSTVRLQGQLDARLLRRTLHEVLRRHEVLRTSFVNINGRPVQHIDSAADLLLKVPIVDLSALPEAYRLRVAKSLAQQEARRPFDLSTGPLLRTTLLRLSAEEHVVLFTMHHIVSDAWSMSVLVREVATLYEAFSEGRPSPLPELPIQYADYAVWQRNHLQGETMDQQLGFWRKYLAGAPAVLELPTDYSRPPVQTFRGAAQSFVYPAELLNGLKQLSRRENVTLFMTLLASFKLMLSRYAKQEDVLVGTAVANRTRRETEGLIGFFINSLVLRTDLSGNPRFTELLRRVRESCLGAYAHQEVPFERLVEELRPERSLSHSPIFQVSFGLNNAPRDELKLPGLQLKSLGVDDDTVRWDLAIWVVQDAEGLRGRWTYRTELFKPETIRRITVHWETLLRSIIASPEARIQSLEMLTEEERKQRERDEMMTGIVSAEKLLTARRKTIRVSGRGELR